MNFNLSDEQKMIQDAAAGFLAEVSSSQATRRAMACTDGFDRSVWQRLCEEMYWQGIIIPEDVGGLGLGYVDLCVVFEQMGRHLHVSPMFPTMLAAAVLSGVAATESVSALYERMLAGNIVTLAHTSANPDWGLDGLNASAVRDGDGWRLSGEYRFVPLGHAADVILVAARYEQDPHRVALFEVRPGVPGCKVERTATMDTSRPMARLHLDDVVLSSEACLSCDAFACVDAALDLVRILLAADQVGGAQASLDLSVAYAQERVQFGRSVASFQAIKHKAADMMMKVESARSLLYYAACAADEWVGGRAARETLSEAAAMVSALAGDTYFFCAGSGIQIHGGVGITEEYDIQLYFKRARSTESYLGTPTSHRETVASMLLDGD